MQAAREQVRARLTRLAVDRFTEARPAADADDVAAAVRRAKELGATVQRLWPVPSPAVLVRRLLGSRAALARAADGLLTPDEQTRLGRKPSRKQADEAWTRADLSLLDEADFVVNGSPRTYGHVVVDEAQDHSAMELRALGRRTPERSMTILGDLAQATANGAQSAWTDALAALDAPRGRVAELELGYRVPAPVLDYANRLLPVAAPGVRPSRSVRTAGESPTIVTAATESELTAGVADAVTAAREEERSVGIVAPAAAFDAVASARTAAGTAFADGRSATGLDDAVTIVLPEAAKGLEFDVVVVVEPAAIAAVGDHGLRLLYIALTARGSRAHRRPRRPAARRPALSRAATFRRWTSNGGGEIASERTITSPTLTGWAVNAASSRSCSASISAGAASAALAAGWPSQRRCIASVFSMRFAATSTSATTCLQVPRRCSAAYGQSQLHRTLVTRSGAGRWGTVSSTR